MQVIIDQNGCESQQLDMCDSCVMWLLRDAKRIKGSCIREIFEDGSHGLTLQIYNSDEKVAITALHYHTM